MSPDDLVERFDVIKACANTNELAEFFGEHGYSPDQWFAGKRKVESWSGGRGRSWYRDQDITWDTLESKFLHFNARKVAEHQHLLEKRVSLYRTKYYIRKGDIEIWVDCHDEEVSVSNLGRIRSWAKGRPLMTPRGGSPKSGQYVVRKGRKLYVKDLMRKYIYSVPGMV